MTYTTRQAAGLLGVTYANLYYYVRLGLIKPKRIEHIVLWSDNDITKMRKHLAELKAKRGQII